MTRVLDIADDAALWLRNNAKISVPVGLLIVVGVVLLFVLGGGDDKPKVPANASAVVGDIPISNADVEHWQQVYVKSTGASGAAATAQARDAAFQMLVQGAWITKEAQDKGVTVTAAKIAQAEDNYIKQLGGDAKNKSALLAQAGLSASDLRYQMRVSLLTNALQEQVTKKVAAPSAAAINAEYQAHPGRWAQPSKRDVRVVIAGTQAQANAAKKALAGGQTFGEVNKKYSVDQTLAASGGVLKDYQPGSTTGDFENPIFDAQPNVLSGPVKTTAGWMVFKVQKVTPLAAQTVQQATAKIKEDLQTQSQAKALASYITGVQKRWKGKTVCSATVAKQPVCPAA